jgi:ornithine decarboxylase
MFFGVALPHGLAPGDQVYIYTAGAYTTYYASAFNGFNAPPPAASPSGMTD